MNPHHQRRQAPALFIWQNPIFRRYARSRMRPKGFGMMALLVLMIASFMFFVTRQSVMFRLDLGAIDAARAPLIPLLVLQAIVLFFIGTGQVAGGMTAEGDEGVVDYQRLAPMTPLAKTLGYLFGLPVREYALFLLTMPFSIYSLWKGQVPIGISCQLYGIFLTSAMLYHTTGLVAGTVIKNRRWAFLFSIGAVFLLYTVVPQMAKFGLVYFKYLTLWPVYEECMAYLIPRDAGAVVETINRLAPPARFFNIDLPQAVFTALSQIVFIVAGLVMVWRRWRRAESHLLGKIWATGLFAWIQLLLLGNALPLIDDGDLFPSRAFNRFQTEWNFEPDPMESVVMIGLFGFVTMIFIFLLMLVITPDFETRVRGWRRAGKQGRKRLPFASDASSGFGWTVLMVLLGGAGWFVFARGIVTSHWFYGVVPWRTAGAFLLCLATAALGGQALLESKGKRTAYLVGILGAVLPILVAVILAVTRDELIVPAIWLGGCSPVTGPVYAAISEIGIAEFPRDIDRAVPRAFWFWQSILALIAIRLIWSRARSGFGDGTDQSSK